MRNSKEAVRPELRTQGSRVRGETGGKWGPSSRCWKVADSFLLMTLRPEQPFHWRCQWPRTHVCHGMDVEIRELGAEACLARKPQRTPTESPPTRAAQSPSPPVFFAKLQILKCSVLKLFTPSTFQQLTALSIPVSPKQLMVAISVLYQLCTYFNIPRETCLYFSSTEYVLFYFLSSVILWYH